MAEVYSRGPVRGWDWLFGVLTLVAFVGVVMLGLGYSLMAGKNTRYPFEPWEWRVGTGFSALPALGSSHCRSVTARVRSCC